MPSSKYKGLYHKEMQSVFLNHTDIYVQPLQYVVNNP